jgi:hypothetical protein
MGYQIIYYPPPAGIPAAGLTGRGGITNMIPGNYVAPTISGTAQVGQTLTGSAGSWTNSPTSFAYQWNDEIGAIPTATGITYTPVATDIGDPITFSVIAINSFGPSFPAISVATSAVIDIIPTINTAASIPGIPQVGSPITPIDAIWNNSVTSRTYQWKVGGVNATGPGATQQTYTPVVGDIGSTLTITVTATNTGGTSSPSTSAASAAVVAASAGGVLDFSQAIDSTLITIIIS